MSTKLEVKANVEKDAKEIAALILSGIDAWRQAGALIAKRVDDDPDYLEKLSEQMPEISIEHLRRLEDIGRNLLDPRLLLNYSPGIRRLSKLPFGYQQKYIDNPIPVVVRDNGTYDTVKMDVRNMTMAQAMQAIADDHIRSAAEQRAFIEDRLAKKYSPPVDGDLPYRVVRGSLVVMKPCTFERRDIAKLLAEMEK